MPSLSRGLVPLLLATFAGVCAAQNVKMIPLGTHNGELCNRDRAMILEDPTGVRILYDPGQSVLGGDDPRLGTVHLVLLSHAHGDHMGDQRLTALEAGTCNQPTLATAAPNTTTAEIAASKNAGLVMIIQMANFLGKRVESIKGRPTGACPVGSSGDDHTVPFAAACLAGNNLGGTRSFKTANATKAVEVTIVPASHDSSVTRGLLSEAERKNLEPDNLSLPLGPPSGYVVRFTNGLVVYFTGDTAVHADQKTVVADFHKPNLMVLNLGVSSITMASGAYIANDIVKPATVVITHPNEAATQGGKARPGSRTEQLSALLKSPTVLAVSGRTIEFDGQGKCVAGCS
ncbi:MAG: MBL fold metallo-hydrolase [Vicinamibacteria bacterium]|jgi:L-ascorbate metabolism protein UlaG (beta-lactamase superfamily)